MSRQGGGPGLGEVLAIIAVCTAIACVIGNARGQRYGCEDRGQEIRGLECVDKKEK